MINAWYNTKEGIVAAMTSLEGLHHVLDARREAHYQHQELLEGFILMGRWWLDACGNVGIAQGKPYTLPKLRFPKIPDVLTEEELQTYLAALDAEDCGVSWAMGGGSQCIAQPHIPCASCGKTWELADCHDCERHYEDQIEPLADFMGQKFGQFRLSLEDRTDARYLVQPELEIRNDRLIDLRPKPGYETLKMNESGWARDAGIKIDSDYVIQPGDETLVVRFTYFHPACHAAKLANATEASFRDAFVRAGFTPESLTLSAIANRYGSESYRGPWYEVQTLVGTIIIGWRKRVVQIDWEPTGRNLLHLFPDVKDTKDDTLIHAWTMDQMVDYLSRIRTALEAGGVPAH